MVPDYCDDFYICGCDGTNCTYICSRCATTRTNTLANVASYFFDNMGRTADKLLGYYYDVNNDGYVNLRDYVLIQRFQAGIGLTQPEPETPETPKTTG